MEEFQNKHGVVKVSVNSILVRNIRRKRYIVRRIISLFPTNTIKADFWSAFLILKLEFRKIFQERFDLFL